MHVRNLSIVGNFIKLNEVTVNTICLAGPPVLARHVFIDKEI